jgi:hypothetical protein
MAMIQDQATASGQLNELEQVVAPRVLVAVGSRMARPA